MSTPTHLKFRARGEALVQDFEKMLQAKPLNYIGRKQVMVGERMAFAPTNEDHVVPYLPEYIKACADGGLFPADEETAKICNEWAQKHPDCRAAWPGGVIKFDPHFGAAPPAEEPPTTGGQGSGDQPPSSAPSTGDEPAPEGEASSGDAPDANADEGDSTDPPTETDPASND